MPVTGYNVVPDVNDDQVIGVELETTNEYHLGKACVYINEWHSQTEMHLDYNELCALIWDMNGVRREMEWAQATYVHAPMRVTDTCHLQHKGDDPHGKALCGQLPKSWGITGDHSHAWEQSPVLGDPYSSHTCKRCYAVWKREQQEAK